MVKVLEDKILIRKLEPENKTPNGLILTGKIDKLSEEAEVVNVGEGRLLGNGKVVKTGISKGDKIVYDARGIIGEIVVNNEKLYLIRLSSVHCIL